jgi:hypothetical protein
VVERDGGGEGQEAAGQAGSEAVQGAGAVAFEGVVLRLSSLPKFGGFSRHVV